MPYIDRISCLPEEILCHILSFLPTTQAVATSVLSHRWTNIWRNVTALNLTDVSVYNRHLYLRFNQFVNSVLRSREGVEHLEMLEINKVYQRFDEIPTFHNLVRLKLHSINYNWSLFVQMLNHCPNLQNVELCQGFFGGDGRRGDAKENWTDPKFVPTCLSLHLKTCILSYLSGKKDDFLMATYILKNARVLQSMAITCHNDPKTEREFSLCPKASPTCQLRLGLLV